MVSVTLLSVLLTVLEQGNSANIESKDVMRKIKGGSYLPLYKGLNVKNSKNESRPPQTKVPDFEMDIYPVTMKNYLDFVKANPKWRRSETKQIFADKTYLQDWKSDLEISPTQSPSAPVRYVSWFAASAYCEWRGARLPTTDEWEFVANSSELDSKSSEKAQKEFTRWYSEPTPKRLPTVQSGTKNNLGIAALGLMVWEWTLDYNSSLVSGESRADGELDRDLFCGAGSQRATDVKNYIGFMRYGYRSSLRSNYTTSNLGFRCAKGMPDNSIYHLDSTWKDESGKSLQLSSLRDSPVIFALMYMSCTYSCPIVVNRMKEIERDLKEKDDVVFLLVTIDPERDTVEKFIQLKKQRELGSHWKFFRGSDTAIRALAGLVGFNYRKEENGDFSHSTLITLLDKNGVISSQLMGAESDRSDFLKKAHQILSQASSFKSQK